MQGAIQVLGSAFFPEISFSFSSADVILSFVIFAVLVLWDCGCRS